MKFLNEEEVRVCLSSSDLKMNSGRFLHYDGANAECFSISLEDKPSRVIALADYLVPTWEDMSFEGALLWFKDWDIWDDYSSHVCDTIISRMRLADGATDPLDVRPGQLFESSEIYETHSYLLTSMLFGMDAFLIPKQKDYFLFVSHDSFLEVVCKTVQTYHELYQRVQDWKPQQDKKGYPMLMAGKD